jgi:hypothetical protein
VGLPCVRLAAVDAFAAHEEEGSRQPQRAAQRAAELMTLAQRLVGVLVERIRGIERGVTEELVD